MNFLLIILGLLPGFVWLFFYLQEDLHPEPKRLIAWTFFAGAVSAFVALFAEEIFANLTKNFGAGEYSLFALLGLAVIEEITKFGAAYFSIHKSSSFDEPIDAMIYMVVAALGFATVENIAALFSNSGGSPLAAIGDIFATAAFRFNGTTLLHSLTSGVIGYYWALSIREFGLKKPLIQGIILASLLHAFFNFLIIYYKTLIYPIIFVAILGFFILNDFEKLKRENV